MKKIAILLVFVSFCAIVSANDTLVVNNANIEKIIEHKTTNTKGAPIVKYYFLYNKELISTNKTTTDKYKLCKQYGATIKLLIVKGKSSTRIVASK